MNTKMSGTIWSRVTIAVAFMVVLGMLLGVTSASGDDGVIETPAITATPTPTAEPTDDSVAEVPEVDSAAKVEDEGEKPETKPTNAPAPPATATAEITDDPVIEVPEVEDEGENPETDAPAPTATATATAEITDDPVIEVPEPTQAPTDDSTEDSTEDPTEEQTPPMEQFVDVVVGECQVTITQKEGVDWTEVIADNGTPNHWGITKGNPTLVVKPVDLSKDLVVRIIPVISENESWEYSVTLEAGSCNNPDPGPTPDPKSGNLVESSLVCRPEGGGTVTTTTTPWTQDWVLEDGKWVLGEIVYGETVETTRPATEQECPATKPSPTPTEPTTKPTPSVPAEPTVKPTAKSTAKPTVKPTAKSTAKSTKVPTTAPSGDPGSDKDKSDPKGPAKTGAIGDDSNGAILVGAALAAVLTLALVAMRMGRRPGGKYAARS